MEYLIVRGIPQRTAHEIVGKLVAKADSRGVTLSQLTDAELQSTHPDLGPWVLRRPGSAQRHQGLSVVRLDRPGRSHVPTGTMEEATLPARPIASKTGGFPWSSCAMTSTTTLDLAHRLLSTIATESRLTNTIAWPRLACSVSSRGSSYSKG